MKALIAPELDPMRTAFLLLSVVVACRPTAAAGDRRAALAELDSVLSAARTAHLQTSAGMLAGGLADTLISIDDGAVSRQPRDSVRAMFDRYFAGASYHAWDDVEPPIVQISDDNSMAWVGRVVCVDREEPSAAGGRARRTFVSAYSATFVRRSGRWQMTTVTSTFVPKPPSACPPRHGASR